MNDIYLYSPPKDFAIIKEILEAGGIQLHSRDVELQGYLGLNLEFEDVTATLYLLQKAGARATAVPVIYRDTEPKLTLEEARSIAEPFLWKESHQHHPEYHFDPLYLVLIPPTIWYQFGIKSEFIPKRGNILFFVSVDILDGHIWEPRETEYLYFSLRDRMYRLRSGEDKPWGMYLRL